MYALSVWIHVVAATAWIGSMIFFSIVVVPVMRMPEIRASAPRLLRLVGPRFRALGWVSLGLLVMTGTSNLVLRGIGWTELSVPAFWSTAFGRPLAYKLGLVAIVLATTGAHDLLTGRRAVSTMEASPTSAEAVRLRLIASWIGRLVLVASLAILYFATALVRGFF